MEYVLKDGQFVKLGSGSYGLVMLARHRRQGHLLAVKLIKVHESYKLASTLKEASIGMLLNETDATPKCYGVVITHMDSIHAAVGIVHGYIGDTSSFDSVTVEKLLHSKEESVAMTAMDCLQLMYNLVMCVMAIHKLGVVSTDLKANNIMARKDVEGKWNVHLIDFGMASYRSAKASLTFPRKMHIRLSARFPHMPMEYFSLGTCGQSTDVYAIGHLASTTAQVLCPNKYLKRVGMICMNPCHTERPDLEQVQKVLVNLMELEDRKQRKRDE